MWQSPDPILESYMAGKPAGGVFAPANLSSYIYAHQNPIRLKDPNGAWVEDVFIGLPSLGLGLWSLGSNVIDGNWAAAGVDAVGIGADAAAIVTPGVPGGAGFGIKLTREGGEQIVRRSADDIAQQSTRQIDEALAGTDDAGDVVARIPDDALVCRGGACQADSFRNGSGVSTQADGTLDGVSVNSRPGATVEELSSTFPHKQVGVTTVGDIRAAGGDVVASPTRNNPYHSTLSGVTPETAQDLFTPTIRNPNID